VDGLGQESAPDSRELVRFRGRVLGTNAIHRIRGIIRDLGEKSQVAVARRICEVFDFRRPNGQPAIRGCIAFLFKLARRRRISLPQSWWRKPPRAKRSRPSTDFDADHAFAAPAGSDSRGLFIRLVQLGERAAFRGLIERHHYLGYRNPAGESVLQVAFFDGVVVALLQWSSATLHNPPRDQWIEWNAESKQRCLHLVANNARFLILPGAQASAHNLASRILSHCLRRLSLDFERLYAHPVLLAETFVDSSRFRGTCYRASNWLYVGETSGYSRRGSIYWHHGHKKAVFLYPLRSHVKARLNEKECPEVAFRAKEASMILNVDALALDGEGGLFEILKTITDPRKRRGVRHPSVSLLAMAATASLAGHKSVTAIAQWAENLPVEFRKRLGSTRPEPPDESTFRRLFTKIDVAELDRKTGEWARRYRDVVGKGIALDGKTLRGSGYKDTPPAHLVSAVLHEDGVVLSQTRVAEKSNEITSVKPVLKDLDVAGAVITGDAMFAQTEIAKYIVEEKKADYLFTVKDNQPGLKAAIENMRLESFSPSACPEESRARPD
jgi:hypothetical protein